MNIAFFTENPFIGKLARNQGGRTDMNWIISLDAEHYSFQHSPEEKFDLGIIIVPKKSPQQAFDYFERFSHSCNIWASMQEGPFYGFQDYEVSDQLNYLNLLSQMNLLLCHNEPDKPYFEGLFPEKRVETFPPVLIEDSIPVIPHENRFGSMISGNMVSWYGGLDSFIVGQILSDLVYAPSMGRKQLNEESIAGLVHLPYLSWQNWLLELNKRKYGVNLMRTFAAGSFSLACARLGIPCIGWGRVDETNPEGNDCQRLCFPELTVPTGNMKKAIQAAKHLKENSLFYDHCSQYAVKKYNEIYPEKIFIDKIHNIFNQTKKEIV